MSTLTTFLIRHGRTDYSARYLVTATHSLHPTRQGRRMCLLRRPADGTSPLHTDVDRQSARSNPADRSDPQERPPTCLSINPPLNELGYGAFEGAPRPPEAGESHREGIRRMILRLVAALEQPGPRIVIAHGLLLPVLGWHMARTPGAAMPPFFPEALHLVPLAMLDDHLADRASSLLEELDAQVHPDQPAPGDSLIFGAGTAPILATFDSLSAPLEETPHA